MFFGKITLLREVRFAGQNTQISLKSKGLTESSQCLFLMDDGLYSGINQKSCNFASLLQAINKNKLIISSYACRQQ
ncbi:hypothetical protein BLX24_04050 [Arsenicibacter rosenii]|uniref:Uncharacterized protein n=1 Tax=Arsenicibacter rosenii TaxID=1750698 RepID=A0A1S2VMP2_9BACT|nr:hypothetical protein BLX24_04050 [Arsenicibacter rosenii]